MRRNAWRPFVIAILIAGVTGLLLGQRASRMTAARDALFLDGTSVSFWGELEKKEVKNGQDVYYLSDVTLSVDGQSLPCLGVLYIPEQEYPIGTMYRGTATVRAFSHAANEGNYDAYEYYTGSGYFFKLEDASEVVATPPDVSWREFLYRLRMRIADIYTAHLPGEESGILQALALGEKATLSADAKKLYQVAGIAHILAISGLHISVVGRSLYQFLRKRGMGFVVAGILSGIAVFLFAEMSGMGSSSKRAVIMYLLFLLAAALGRTYDSLSALAAAAILLAAENPLIVKNTGVIFSFLAVLGVVSFASVFSMQVKKRREERLEEKGIDLRKLPMRQRLLFRLVDDFMLSLGIQLYTLPIVAQFYYEVPIYSVFLNMILLPFVGLLLGCGLLGGFAGFAALSCEWMVGDGLGRWICEGALSVCHVILYFYEWMADVSIHLPAAVQIVGKPGVLRILFYYAMLYVLLYLRGRRVEKDRKEESENRSVEVRHIVSRKWCSAALVLVIFFLVRPHTYVSQIVMLDVGQGDGIFLHEKNGMDLFIDGGSTSVTDVAQYRMLPFLKSRGVRKIDCWFVTHLDEDHISGLRESMEAGYNIDTLVFSKYVVRNEVYEELVTLARENGTEVAYMVPGDQCVGKQMRLSCVGPTAELVEKYPEDTNAGSMMLSLTYGEFQALFTGDIAAEQEEYYMEHAEDLMEQSHVNLLKVAHHGSKYSSSKAFLESIAPEVALISCGKRNLYGHPHAEAIERLEASGAKIYRTDEEAQITVVLLHKKICYNKSYEKD